MYVDILDNLMTPNEVRELLGLKPINEPYNLVTKSQNDSTNCPNCGAPITSWKCDYCDTVFDKDALEKIEKLIFKMEQLQTSKQIKSLYEDAIKSIRKYRGIGL